jgi:hypothetical protein
MRVMANHSPYHPNPSHPAFRVPEGAVDGTRVDVIPCVATPHALPHKLPAQNPIRLCWPEEATV